MKVVATPDHLLHDCSIEVEWGVANGHWEVPVRAEVIAAALREWPDDFEFLDPTEHGRGPIEAVHDPRLVDFLARAWIDFQQVRVQREVFPDTYLHSAIREGMAPLEPPDQVQAALGYWCFESMTPVLEGTYRAARAAVDVALTTVDLVLGGERVAYGLCRPPGHHAPRAAFGGYCYFNNAAIAAQALVSATGQRVAVLDVDYHHGNGTQQIFYDRDDVLYVSIHGDPRRAYPYLIGYESETGTGRGLGQTLNLPLAERADDELFEGALTQAIDAIDRFGAATVVVSLGVDTYRLDPIGDFAVTTEAYRSHGSMVQALGLPTVIVQEGGYHVPALGANVTQWLLGAAGR